MATNNGTPNDDAPTTALTSTNTSTSNVSATAPSKSTKIVLKRVLEINDDLRLHLYGTQLIVEAGLMLNIPQITIAKAQTIFHRFYYQQTRDLLDYPPFHIAMTCTYLASKLDENTRRHRDILTVFDRLHKKRNYKHNSSSNVHALHVATIDPHGKRYVIWKENLFNFEIRILAAMGFNCIDSAHKYLLQLLVDLDAKPLLAKQAWTLLNDFHRVPNITDFTCLQVACACIFLAARRLKIKLPDDPSWCDLFGVDKTQMHEIASIMLELLELPKTAYKIPSSITDDDEALDCNPRTVQHQMKVLQKRNTEKQKRLKAAAAAKRAAAEQRAAATAQSSSSSSTAVNGDDSKMKSSSTTQPVSGIKQINLNIAAKLSPPCADDEGHDDGETGAEKHKTQVDAKNMDVDSELDTDKATEKEATKEEEEEKGKKSRRPRDKEKRREREHEREHDRDRDRRHNKYRADRTDRSRRRRRHSHRDDDRQSSDSEYHSKQHRRYRQRSTKRERSRSRSKSRSVSSRASNYSRNRSRSRSKTPDKERNKTRSRSGSKQKETEGPVQKQTENESQSLKNKETKTQSPNTDK